MLSPEEGELLQVLPGAVVASGADGRIVFANQEACGLLGFQDPSQLNGQPLTVLMPDRMVRAHRDGFQRYLRTGRSRLLGRRVRVPARSHSGEELMIDMRIRMFRRPDGTDLIVAAITAATADPGVLDVALLRLETTLESRAYALI